MHSNNSFHTFLENLSCKSLKFGMAYFKTSVKMVSMSKSKKYFFSKNWDKFANNLLKTKQWESFEIYMNFYLIKLSIKYLSHSSEVSCPSD